MTKALSAQRLTYLITDINISFVPPQPHLCFPAKLRSYILHFAHVKTSLLFSALLWGKVLQLCSTSASSSLNDTQLFHSLNNRFHFCRMARTANGRNPGCWSHRSSDWKGRQKQGRFCREDDQSHHPSCLNSDINEAPVCCTELLTKHSHSKPPTSHRSAI